MPEVASIFNGVQIGVEATPGTSVAANKLLNYLSLTPNPDIAIDAFRPMGQLVPSAVVPTTDDTAFAVEGRGTYSELVYPFCSLLTNVSPSTVDTSARLWDFVPLGRSEDTVKTYTIEGGSSTRAQKATYGLFNGMEITFNKANGVTIAGSAFGQQLQDNITLTGSPTAIEDKPIYGAHLDVFMDTTSAGLGTTKLTRDFNAVFRYNDKWGKVRPINSTLASYGSHVNTEPTVEMELTVAADTQGMALLADLRSNNATKYIRMQAEAPGATYGFAGAATATYHVKIDMAGKVSGVSEFGDEEGVKVITFTYSAVYDAAWGTGRYMRAQVQNKVTAL